MNSALSSGELNAEFQRLFETSEGMVRGVLFRMLGSKEDVDELAQEVFIKAWKSFGQFNNQSNVKTWIYRITVNTALDHLRKQKLKGLLSLASNAQVEPTTLGSNLEMAQLIQVGLQRLSNKHRVVFILYYFEELTIDEISKALKLSAGTIKSRLHHARKVFTGYLKSQGVNYE